MIKIYQTIFERGTGNCMPAVMASLFHIKMEDVPHFITQENWFKSYCDFFPTIGWDYYDCLNNIRNLGHGGEDRFPELKELEGIDGYFEAAVYSPKYFKMEEYLEGNAAKHAVIVDKDCNIVHDPCIDYKDLKDYPLANLLGYHGVTDIFLHKKIK